MAPKRRVLESGAGRVGLDLQRVEHSTGPVFVLTGFDHDLS